MNQTARPVPGQRYRHFKGNLYQIITIGYHSETDEEMVVYQALYGDFKVYIRPLAMFMESVDKEKYPETKQEYRFQLVSLSETSTAEGTNGETNEETSENTMEQTCDNRLLLVRFLDAETYEEKLKIFMEMQENIDEITLTNVAASIDISTGTGTLEEQYASVQYALQTLAKYERNKR